MSNLEEMKLSTTDESRASTRGRLVIAPYLPLLILLATGTLVLANNLWLDLITSSMIAAIAIAGVGLLYGRLGMIALNQYALVGVGGWVAMRLDQAFAWPFELSMICSGVVVAMLGILWGLPALRLRGVYLALVTLMMAGAFQVVIVAVGFPEGGPGFFAKVTDASVRLSMHRPAIATSDHAYFIYVSVVLGFVLAAVEWHQRNRPARAWALIRRDERMAAMAGADILLTKVWAFGLAGVFAGISGALLAGLAGTLEGPSFTAVSSLMLFAIAVIAGAANPIGAIAGGFLLKVPSVALAKLGLNGFLAQVLLGLLLLQALTAGTDGVAGDLVKLHAWVRRRILGEGGMS
ncbi:branched-chain amino acid ABC transporter permease [Bradyrhizobium sp. PRIMUS42]|uniref:branched-chain amino acid ABC transporter permease n=1 Tax=Bradyrhizobium sp. PRIMUS42 TaxID=2908926 RepID=UPI001FF428BD|nr:branched-chain amino acid ABC transporter permease [Bradyrhizobium sp. PRIMUS42]